MAQNFSELANFIWSVADLLRGDYKQADYGKVILPFTLLRRLECVLESTKKDVLAEHAKRKDSGIAMDLVLRKKSKESFFNVSPFDLPGLLADQKHIRQNLVAYLGDFSEDGFAALSRLLPVALRDTGQSGVIARFLLNLYNGYRFPFDMTDFRRLDHNLFVDCMTVLQMDYLPEQEVHKYFERGGAIWEQMAADWGFKDYQSESWR